MDIEKYIEEKYGEYLGLTAKRNLVRDMTTAYNQCLEDAAEKVTGLDTSTVEYDVFGAQCDIKESILNLKKP